MMIFDLDQEYLEQLPDLPAEFKTVPTVREEQEEYEEEMSDEDYELFDREANSREHYAEPLQFVNVTHTSKQDGREHKKDAASGAAGGARFCTAYFTFDELVDYHSKGMTFRRLPETAVQKWSTRFMVLDFDNKSMLDHDPVNVTTDELDEMIRMLNLTARYTPSGDKLPYHHHLFILLDKPVCSAEEYKTVRDGLEQHLRTALEFLRGVSSLPRLTDPRLYAQTTIFAPKQDTEVTITKVTWEIDDEGRWSWGQPTEHLERTIECPKPRYTATNDSVFKDYLVPLSTSQFARWLVIHGVSDKELLKDLEYDFRIGGNILKYLRPGASKVSRPILVGERDATVSAFLLKLYAKTRSYNLWLSEHGHGDLRFTKKDVTDSFVHYLENAYVLGHKFALDPYVNELERRCDRFEGISDREYCELCKKWSTGRHEFKTRRYVRDTAQELVDRFKDGDCVRFPSKEERDRILKENAVSLPTLRKMAGLYRLSVVTGSRGGARSGSGRKPSVSWETLSSKGDVVDGVFYYVETLSPTEKKFIYNEGVKIKRSKKEKSEESK